MTGEIHGIKLLRPFRVCDVKAGSSFTWLTGLNPMNDQEKLAI